MSVTLQKCTQLSGQLVTCYVHIDIVHKSELSLKFYLINDHFARH